MKEFNLDYCRPGFQGHDSMRENAERLFREDIAGSGKYPVKESVSAMDREHRRPFKKGGHVSPKNEGGACKKGGRIKKDTGGAVEHQMQAVKKGGPIKKNMGGIMGAIRKSTSAPMAPQAAKKGGRIKKNAGGLMQAINNARAPMAMGGIGKLRHGEMTKGGKQIAKKGAKLGR